MIKFQNEIEDFYFDFGDSKIKLNNSKRRISKHRNKKKSKSKDSEIENYEIEDSEIVDFKNEGSESKDSNS